MAPTRSSLRSAATIKRIVFVCAFMMTFAFMPAANALPPLAPTGVTAVAGDGSATVTWVASLGATSYTATSSPGGLTCSTTLVSCSVTGLTNGTSYTFAVTAINVDGSATSSPSGAVIPLIAIPLAPTGVTAVAGDGLATVAWVASIGAATYTVTSNPGGLTCNTAALTCSVVGLVNGTSYTFSVTATNSSGTSAPSSATTAAIPLAVVLIPLAPTGVTAVAADGLATVAWVASVGANSYTVTSTPGGLSCTTALLTCSVSGLSNGTSYTFAVTATNTAGTSGASAPSAAVIPVLAATIPLAPTGVTAVAGDGTAVVAWVASVGATSYTVTSSPGGLSCTTALLTCSVPSLINGTSYTFTVKASNTAGTSGASSPSASVIPLLVPFAPTGVTAVAADASATVAWVASFAASSYTVTSSPGGVICTTVISPCLVSPLTNGTAYSFAVTATNTSGTSAPSVSSNTVTPSAPLSVPLAPTGVTAVAADGLANVAWVASVGATSYTVTSSPGGVTCTTAFLTCAVTGLTNGTSYTFAVKATNSAGTSPASTSSAVVIPLLAASIPLAPTGVTAVAADGLANVAWVASVGATSYTVTSSPGGVTCTTAFLTCAVAPLIDGTSYTFTVKAINSSGTSSASTASASVVPLLIPFAPTGVNAVGGDGAATVAWVASFAAASYTVTSSPGGLSCTTVILSCSVSGLSNGTSYTFAVVATNTSGSSAPSVSSAAITPSPAAPIPAAPSGVTAVAGDGAATVAWVASVGATSYTVTSSPGGFTCTSTFLSCLVPSLSDGTSYTFTVKAVNSAGTSPASAASAVVIPLLIPLAPTGVTAVAADGLATVAWVASVGATSYTVTSSPGGLTCATAFITCSIAPLNNGTSYTFSVRATNSAGTSAASVASNPVIPILAAVAPVAPTGMTVVAGDGAATVAWLASVGATSYTVTANPSGLTCTTTFLTCAITPLIDGTSYTFTVKASNSAGTSIVSAASASIVPQLAIAAPIAPTGVIAVAGDGLVTVTWLASLNSTSYTVTSSPGGLTCSTSSLRCVISPLNNGTSYTFTVTATNSAGTSLASIPSASVIASAIVPSAPTGVSAVAGDSLARVLWIPVDGATSYTLSSSPGGVTCISVLTFCSVSPLINGTSYTFTVTATNTGGTSSASLVSNAVIPQAVPLAPTKVTAVAGETSAVVSWAPSIGATSYTASSNPGSLSCTTALLTCSVSSLRSDSAYAFNVVATNSGGSSAPSLLSNTITPIQSAAQIQAAASAAAQAPILAAGQASAQASAQGSKSQGAVGAVARPISGSLGELRVTLVAPVGGSIKLMLEASVTGKVSPIRCGGQSCVIAATKPNTAQSIVEVTTQRIGKTTRSLIAAVFASRYPDNVFALNNKFRNEVKAFAKAIDGKRGVITIVGSHSHGSHDAYGVKLANARARGIMAEFKKLGVKARIDLITVNAKTVKGGVAGANAIWHP